MTVDNSDTGKPKFSALQILLNNSLLATRHISAAWLIDRDTGNVLAGVTIIGETGPASNDAANNDADRHERLIQSQTVTLSEASAQFLLQAAKLPGQVRQAQQFTWEGRDYSCVRADLASIYARQLKPNATTTTPSAVVAGNDGKTIETKLNANKQATAKSDAPAVSDHDTRSGGLIVAITPKRLLIAVYPPQAYAAVAVEAVERLADYLRTKN